MRGSQSGGELLDESAGHAGSKQTVASRNDSDRVEEGLGKSDFEEEAPAPACRAAHILADIEGGEQYRKRRPYCLR
jgi:hypothetical protein